MILNAGTSNVEYSQIGKESNGPDCLIGCFSPYLVANHHLEA